MLAESNLDSEIIPPELNELCAPDAGSFLGDGYPRPEPSKSFLERMACLGKKQILAIAPDITTAKYVLMDIQLFLQGPSRGANHGSYIPPHLSPWVRIRMEGIHSHLSQYTNQNSVTYRKWSLSVRQAAIAIGRNKHCVQALTSLSRVYIADRKVLPINPYGHWTKSMLADEDLVTDIRNHLQELSKFITAEKLVQYLTRDDVMEKHGLEKTISIETAVEGADGRRVEMWC
ncbi:hypothetical protein B0H14DRAFT_3482442 [Mycena olivaceomarginata]|nr:hypothetical protein B0H14DRAFT_3482442 [Mycena olivaceomarginata]